MYHLSDPWLDFQDEEDQEWLRRVVAKNGQGLTSYDFVGIFQNYLPAGTYEECLCYLPHVLDYLRNKGSEDAAVLHHVMWFLSHYEVMLKRDGKLHPISKSLIEILKKCCLFNVFQQEDLLDHIFKVGHMMESLLEYPYGLHLFNFLKEVNDEWQNKLSYSFVIVLLTLDNPWIYDDEKYSARKLWNDLYSGERLKCHAINCLNNLHLLKKTSCSTYIQNIYYDEFRLLLKELGYASPNVG